MARRISVELIGNASQLERTFSRAGKSAQGFNKDLNRATRGTLAGSGVFKSLGRSIAFASGGFLAFASAGHFIRTSIDAAIEAAVTQKQLAAQFKASGKNLADYQKQIDDVTLSLSGLSGFTKDDLDRSFTTLFRSTNDVSKALHDNAIAADLARGRHMDLQSAALLVSKVVNGNVGLLKRYGIAVTKGETVTQALAAVQKKYAGQAAAGATAQDKFGASLHNSEVIIGSALLPTMNHLLVSATKWLTKMNRSGKLQRDVNQAVRVGGQVVHGFADALKVAHAVLSPVNRLLGGTRHSAALLTAAFIAFKLRGVVALVSGVGTAVKALAKLTLAEDIASKSAPMPGQKTLPGLGGASKFSKFSKLATAGLGIIAAGEAYGIYRGVTAPAVDRYGAPQQYSRDGKGHYFRLVPSRTGTARRIPVSAKEYDAAKGIHIHGDLNVHGVQNPKQLVGHLQKVAKRHPHQRRGRHGGSPLGTG